MARCLQTPGYLSLQGKKAIGDYKKASGHPECLAELMVFFCERAAGFAREFGLQDEAYMDALVRMFRQALKQVTVLPEEQRAAMLDRLDRVSVVSNALGYGVANDMEASLADYQQLSATLGHNGLAGNVTAI